MANYRYNGQQYDSLMGMYSLRARYYVPEAGRFISRDQHQGNYEDELNRYVYVAGNPVMYEDPSGNSLTQATLINVFTWRQVALVSSIVIFGVRSLYLVSQMIASLPSINIIPYLEDLLKLRNVGSSQGRTNDEYGTIPSGGLGLSWDDLIFRGNDIPTILIAQLTGFQRKVGTLAEHLAKLLERDVAGYPPSDPNPYGDPDGGWCTTIRRVIQEIDKAGYSTKQLNRELGSAGFEGNRWQDIINAVKDVVELGLCSDHWGGFGGGSLAGS